MAAEEHVMDTSWLRRSAPKVAGSVDRVRTLQETMALFPLIRRRFGITRVADTTWLDRIGIPTTSAVVPDSPDGISVYNGKGPTKAHALCSAVMEAVERQCGATYSPPVRMLRPVDVVGGIDLDAMGLLEEARSEATPFVPGCELLSESCVLVPLAAVRCPWRGARVFRMSTSHGLASGNSLLEAVHHALFEHVERHAWALAHTKAHVRSRLLLEALARALGQRLPEGRMVDDPAVDEIPVPTGDALVDELAGQITRAGLRLRLMLLAEDDLPPVVMASISEDGSSPIMCHFGLGASWSPSHAAARALTEAAQSRAVDIQGAREDLLRPGEISRVFGHHGQRRSSSPAGRWYYDAPLRSRAFSTIPDDSRPCLAEEVRMLLNAFRTVGVRHVVAVDVSPTDLPLSVVRMIVPDLESALADGRVGRHVRALLGGESVSVAGR